MKFYIREAGKKKLRKGGKLIYRPFYQARLITGPTADSPAQTERLFYLTKEDAAQAVRDAYGAGAEILGKFRWF